MFIVTTIVDTYRLADLDMCCARFEQPNHLGMWVWEIIINKQKNGCHSHWIFQKDKHSFVTETKIAPHSSEKNLLVKQ